MTEQEAFYDAEIAPKLLDLAKACQANGLSILAVVEWKGEQQDVYDHGRTFATGGQQSPFVGILNAAAQCRSGSSGAFNFDLFTMTVLRECGDKPTSSIYINHLQRWGAENNRG
jgi:hypothetical protein